MEISDKELRVLKDDRNAWKEKALDLAARNAILESRMITIRAVTKGD